LFILICYATLATIANFDNMFADTMVEHTIKQNVGKRLRTTYHRYMFFKKEEDLSDKHENDEVHENFVRQSMKVLEHPRRNCFMKFLRVIQKTLRVFYVSFFFYFAPFLMLFYQFYMAS